jgi:hypothetical protein
MHHLYFNRETHNSRAINKNVFKQLKRKFVSKFSASPHLQNFLVVTMILIKITYLV